jgi:hypothetical protein
MSEFLYLFRGGDARQAAASPELMQEHMGKWMKWMEDLTKQGTMKGGQPLKNEGKTVKRGSVITDGPFAEGKEIVGGYLIVNAKDIHEATEISKGCPIFEYDGTVEVREIQSMDM